MPIVAQIVKYAKNRVKRRLSLAGFAVINMRSRKNKFGVDPFVDIKILATGWRYPLKVFFDVGANDGETALAILEMFPDARLFSFEPHPRTFEALLSKLGERSRFRGINVALGAVSGETQMFEYDDLSVVNSLTPNATHAVRFGMKGRPIPISCITLDDFCAENAIDAIDVLKIDTEGFEHAVLQGCQGMLGKGAIKFIYVEFNDLQAKEGCDGGALVPIDTLLRPYGYRFVASYNDYISTEGEMFAVSNALFTIPPSS